MQPSNGKSGALPISAAISIGTSARFDPFLTGAALNGSKLLIQFMK
jgi:hypothetical protein